MQIWRFIGPKDLPQEAAVFEMDETKRQANLRKHGVDLIEAAEIFADFFI
jgi:hypothetical protein